MSKGKFYLMILALLVGAAGSYGDVILQVDAGDCGPTQSGWISLGGCGTHSNVGGTGIDVVLETGNPSMCECRNPGGSGTLADVEATLLFANDENYSPGSDFILTLRNLTSGSDYTVYSYHSRTDEGDTTIPNVTVTGATNVTKPSSIVQNHAIMDNPAEISFTAGAGDVVIRYQGPDGGCAGCQAFFNGFELVETISGTTVQFASASSGDVEAVTPALVEVILNNALAGETYTVDYAVIGGTATGGGVDYTLAAGTLTFAPNSVSEFISIDIVDDGLDEDDETIVIELSNPVGLDLQLGSPTQHTYTIVDPRPTAEFDQAGSSGMEDVTPVYVSVSLSAPGTETITVDYDVIGGTATGGGVDYTLDPGTLTFNVNDVTKNIVIDIVSDANEQEPAETIIIGLSNPVGAKLGTQTQYTYTIVSEMYAPFPDSDTVGLWLFDEADYPHTTLTDASEYEKADLCLMDGGSIVSGLYGNALSIAGGDYAVSYAGFAGKVPEEHLREPDGTPSGLWGPTEGSGPLLNGLAGSTWTIELWLNPSTVGSGISIIDLGWAYDNGVSLVLNSTSFKLTNYYAGVQLTCSTSLSAGVWQHLAFTYDGAAGGHFVDGVEQSAPTVSSVTVQSVPDLQVPTDREHESRGFESMSYEQRRQNRFNFAVGTDRSASGALDGMVDEMRISDVVRYSGSFTPASFSRNYGAGALPPSVADGLALLLPETPPDPLSFGTRKHVFIDDAIVDTMSALTITMNQPYGKQEIGKDFTIDTSSWRPSVYDVNGVVYLAIPEGYGSPTGHTYLATAADGLNFSWQGTIISDTPFYGSFFKDLNPNIAPAEQYKVNAFVANRGMYMYISPDGVNWRRNETIQLPLRSGGEGECYWDDQQGEYASFIKRDSSFDDPECADAAGRVAPGFWSDEILKAWPFFHMVTPYFEGYPFPSVTCEGPVIFDVTAATQVYRTRAIKYPWASDVYLAFVWRYPDGDLPRHVDLGVSRDGVNWSFFGTSSSGPWYIPLGSAEEELSLYGLVRNGNEIWQYVDEGGAHGGSAPRTYYRYKQRLDGFVSLDAGGSVGTATTLALVFTGDSLELNVNASGGYAKVAICNQAGVEYAGFGLSDCDLIQSDSIAHEVTWSGSSSISSLSGTTVRLKFEMQNAKLYALEVLEAAVPDTTPPSPDPATFASPPAAVSDTEITMTATTGSDASPPVEYYFDETSGNPGGSDSGWITSTTYNDTGLQPDTTYTYTVTMRDSLGNTGTASTPANATTLPAPDTDPPTPDPATFASAPAAVSDTEITMTATTGSDASPPVEYYFDETSGNPGGTDSGWVTSTTYNDTGLQPDTTYTYTVTMRDSLANTGTASTPANATTDPAPDIDPPTPDPATFDSPPAAVSSSEITMTATTGSDASPPVEYFFDETSGNPGGSDSGWVTDPVYNDTGLDADTQYTYTVQMRDSLANTGTASAPESATTLPAGGPVDDVADSDIAVAGTVTGSYLDTQSSDDVSESIEEIESGGKPVNRHTYLEHKWSIDVTGGSTVTFYVEAYHTANAENDDFTFAYSTTGVDGTYINMLTVTKTADDDVSQSFELPSDTSGVVHIRVTDTDQSQGNRTLDTIYIDQMFIRSDIGPPPPGVKITESNSSTDVDEEGPTSDTYTVVLRTLPTDTVTITVDPDVETEVNSNGAGNPVDLTFLTTNWDTPQTVTVTAIDDGDVEGDHTSIIIHSAVSSDPNYNGIGIDDVVANVADNDCAVAAMHVESIVCDTVAGTQGKKYGRATVTIYDNCGYPVVGALVDGTFSGDYNETFYDVPTDGNGVAVFVTTTQVKKPSFTFCVDAVTDTLTYDSNDNVETCDTN